MFTPPASPAPPRTLRGPSPSSSHHSASEDDDLTPHSQYLAVPRPRSSSPTPLPKRSSSLTAHSHSQPRPTRNQNQARERSQAAHDAAKRRAARHTRWTVLLVPAVLIFITLSTHYLSHPAVLDFFSRDRRPESWAAALTDLRPHKRHASPDPNPSPDGASTAAGATDTASSLILQSATLSVAASSPPAQSPLSASSAAVSFASGSPASSGTGSSSPSTVPVASQTIPPIPTGTPAALPTPFPQPFDQTMANNYSTVGCQDFMTNMTQASAFRTCRPFSLLLQNSDAFIEAQNNLTVLNAIVWGTCNTNTDTTACASNMDWFTQNIQTACAVDLKAGNAIVQKTLTGLQAYALMRHVACEPDQSTGAYCYVEAVHNANPSDLYFYNLALGTALPASATPSCSACTQSVMALYAADARNLSALGTVYDGAATVANGACGAGYVQIASVSRATSLLRGGAWRWMGWGSALLLIALSL
ncbi:hypothetical protein EIP86_001440 [Pleurotus ostreatoroseus]|nr:hypothetical protein EIP86_001440 [Pleurotus ostreatoroseus]